MIAKQGLIKHGINGALLGARHGGHLAIVDLATMREPTDEKTGWTYGQVGKVKEQIAALRQAVTLRPRYATARFNLGSVLLRQGDRKGAEEQYAALLTFDEGAAATLKKEIEGKKP